jgi:hypothetical protein
LVGLLLFGAHSLIHNQRETFLLPVEFFLLLLPIYLCKSFGKDRRIFSNALKVSLIAYLMVIIAPVTYLMLPSKYQSVVSEENLTEDTRSLVLKDYAASDMNKPLNYLLGKGVNGFFKSKLRYNPIGGAGTSLVIEVGYLQMVLNVGLVYALVTVLMGLVPALRAIMKSPNALVVAAGLWVLVRLINMTIAATPRTEMSWFLFWLCIGVLGSAEMMKQVRPAAES